MKANIIILTTILLSFNLYLKAQDRETYENSEIIKKIFSFPHLEEDYYTINDNGFEFSVMETLNEMDISTRNRNAWLFLVKYLINRPDFKWKRTIGKVFEDYDFFGSGIIKNYKDVMIEVRVGCWECEGKPNEMHSVRLILID